ncbi:unnamed protein product [Polarella glacialis]|uniref:RanBP2-type domain-containing protein n=1 Tax=Polarella glacialis TaxID=89957 RepID=A0A813HIC5_POLGL|nr:unnamed protein product [Polarella glacialis]
MPQVQHPQDGRWHAWHDGRLRHDGWVRRHDGHDGWLWRLRCSEDFHWRQNMAAPYSGGAASGGNWMCPSCNNDNFPMRTSCNRCKLPKMGGGMGMQAMGMQGMPGMMMPGMMPMMMGMPANNMRPGDWMCPACDAHNYASKTNCHKCQIPKEARIAKTGMREGDWICSACNNNNFASKTDCNKCAVPKGDAPSFAGKPGGGGREGDWMCASNYAHRTECNRCNIPKP